MGQDIAIRNANPAASLVPLPTSISKALEEVRLFRPDLGAEPLLSPEDRAAVPALIDGFERQLAPVDKAEIPAIIGFLSTAFPARERSEAESRAQLRHYVDGLDDIPRDVLNDACRKAVRECKFMPTVKELRDFAAPPLGKIRWHIWNLNRLAERFDREKARGEVLPPEVAAKKLDALAKRLSKKLAA